MTEFYFDTPTGDVILGVGATAARFTVTSAETFGAMIEAADERKKMRPPPPPVRPEDIPDGVLPIHELILTPGEFPFDSSNYKRQTPRVWDRDIWLAFGAWAVRALRADNARREQPTLMREDIDRFNLLGICAGYKSIHYHFRTMTALRHELNLPTGKITDVYTNWTIADFVAYAHKVSQSLRRQPGHTGRPSREDYAAWSRKLRGKGPGPKVILDRVGGVSALNEFIGFPDIKSWNEEDYYNWGIDVLTANPGRKLSNFILNILSKREHGPSAGYIGARFGISNFQRKVTEWQALKQQETSEAEQEWATLYDTLVERKFITPSTDKLSASEKTVIAARYEVARHCMPTAKPETLDSIARKDSGLVADIRRRSNQTVDAAYIEMVASSLRVFDYVFPIDRDLGHLYVSDEELNAIRYARARTNRRSLERSRQRSSA
jgi:hypothetical protein